MSVSHDKNSILEKAQIFENEIFHQYFHEDENLISKELFHQYCMQFNWLFFENGILQCRSCQEAYNQFQSSVEHDEWTVPNEYSYRLSNKENLILILKVHDFSDNHIKSVNLLKQEFNKISDSFNDSCIQVDETLTLPIISSYKSSARWSQYVNKYPWLYVKQNNPGCRYCETAFKHSTKIVASKWTTSTTTFEINSVGRPYRVLRQHHLSKNHQRAVDVMKENGLIPETENLNNFPEDSKDIWESITKTYLWLNYKFGNYHCLYCEKNYETSDTVIILSELNKYSIMDKIHRINEHQNSEFHQLSEEKFQLNNNLLSPITNDELENLSNFPDSSYSKSGIIDEHWKRLMIKYPWFVGENGKFYGCNVCRNSTKSGESVIMQNPWTYGMISFSIITTYEHLRKKLYTHNNNKNHLARVHVYNNKSDDKLKVNIDLQNRNINTLSNGLFDSFDEILSVNAEDSADDAYDN